MEVPTRSVQSTNDRGFRDFAGGRTDGGQDSMLIGILCGVLGGDGWCGRDRGSNVSRKKRQGARLNDNICNLLLYFRGQVNPGSILIKNFNLKNLD